MHPPSPSLPPEPPLAGGGLPLRWAKAPWLTLVGVWCLVAALHVSLVPQLRVLIWPLGYLLLEMLACASLAYRAWRTPEQGGRLAWWLLAASALLEIPNLIMNWLFHRGAIAADTAGYATYLSLATGFLVLAGVLSFPRGAEGGGRFRRRLLDSLLFATALLFLLWVLGVQASLGKAAQGVGLRVLAAYLNLALLGGGLVFMTSYHPERMQGPLGWLGLSALAWLAAITFWSLAGLPATIAAEPWIVVAGGIPVFQGLASWSPRKVEEVLAGSQGQRSRAALLPYLPASLALVAMALLLIWAPGSVSRAVLGIFLAMVVLLLLRQFLAIQDLVVARRTLEARVQQRTEALEHAQQAILRTERMNTLALMGAGLAHDLNNLLGAVKASADLAVLNLEEGVAPAVSDLTRMASAADRAAQLTRRLMEFARRKEEALMPVDLVQELTDMEGTLRLLLPWSVRFRLDVPSGACLVVQGSKLRLEQMMVNLVANAADAMPEGGDLAIRVTRDGVNHAQVEVVDTGTGMVPETLARIFDPFFTTKSPGKGTGLGLSSLKAMVEEVGGRLGVESQPGQGSRFILLMPLLKAEEVSPR